jgi:hypothetical protein
MKYLADIEVDIAGLEALAALEIVQAPAMGEVSRKGFVDGWSALRLVALHPSFCSYAHLKGRCDTLDKQKAYMKNLKQSLASDKDTFTRIYKYTFQLAKTGNQKAVPLETVCAYWELLFTSDISAVKWSTLNTPWADWWNEYLNTVYKRAVNKDVWAETLRFAQLTLRNDDLSFWNEEQSWPSVIDEFVEWVKKDKRPEATTDAMEE